MDQFYDEAIFSDPIFDDGDRKSWPPCFAEYVKERKTSGKVLQTATFKKDNPGLDRLPADMQPLYLWGKSIKAVADTAKTTINNRLNKVFVPPAKLKSGETPSAVMDAIRKSMHQGEALQKATVYWNGFFQRKKKVGAHLELNKQEFVVAKQQEILASLNSNWFPDFWLSFAVQSLPSGDKCLPCFKTADAASLTQGYVSLVDVNRGILARGTRRRIENGAIADVENVARASTPNPGSGSSAEKKTFVLQVQMPAAKKARIVSNEDKITEWSAKLEQLSKTIDCLEKRVGNEATISKLESQMQELAVLISNATDKMISEASQIGNAFETPT